MIEERIHVIEGVRALPAPEVVNLILMLLAGCTALEDSSWALFTSMRFLVCRGFVNFQGSSVLKPSGAVFAYDTMF